MRALRAKGLKLYEVARIMGRTYMSIRDQVHIHKIARSTPWTSELEQQVLTMRKAGEKITVIAATFGLTDGQVSSRLDKLKKMGLL